MYSLLSHYMLYLFSHTDIHHCFYDILNLIVYMDKLWDNRPTDFRLLYALCSYYVEQNLLHYYEK